MQQKCGVCGDEFEVDFNEDTDRWEYLSCVEYEDRNYHLHCCEDLKNGGSPIQVSLLVDVLKLILTRRFK